MAKSIKGRLEALEASYKGFTASLIMEGLLNALLIDTEGGNNE